jgi:GT2 family glycosyltransferase
MYLSIVIVSWNAKDFLLNCLRSLKEETDGYEVELIVIDNASTDGSPEAVSELFPDVVLFSNTINLGFAKANNLGILKSKGQYIALINPDVNIFKDCIHTMSRYLDQNTKVGMLGPKILNADLTLQSSCRRLPSLWNSLCDALTLYRLFPRSRLFAGQFMTHLSQEKSSKAEVLSGCFWMVKRKALSQVGLLDENFFMYGEDIDWCKRFCEAGWDIIYLPDAQAIHYGGGSSSNDPIRFYIEKQRANLQYWNKHHGSLKMIGFFLIAMLHQLIRLIGHGILYITRLSKRNESVLKISRSFTCIRWLFRNSFKIMGSINFNKVKL